MKLKAAQEANIQCELRKLPETVTEATLLNDIDVLNDDPSVHGILVQLPLPKSINETTITNAVVAEKGR